MYESLYNMGWVAKVFRINDLTENFLLEQEKIKSKFTSHLDFKVPSPSKENVELSHHTIFLPHRKK